MDRAFAPWTFLLVASVFEATWAIGLKYSAGFTKPGPTVLTLVTMLLSFWFLALAVRHIPLGNAYAIWTGIGAVTVALYGIMFLGEPASLMRLISIALIVCGVAGLRLFPGVH